MLPDVRAFIDEIEALNAPKLTELPLEEMRGAFAVSAKMMDEDGPSLAHVSDHIVTGPSGDIPIRLYDPTPGNDTPTRAMVYYHGGGWVLGTLDSHDGVSRRLAAGLGMPVISVEYRLAPEHPFPAAIDDAVAAMRWAATQLSSVIGREVTGLISCGDSAGGNLAAVVPMDLLQTEGTPIDLQVLLYPVTDCATDYPSRTTNGTGLLLETEGMAYFMDAYDPSGSNRTNRRLSPIFADDLSKLPPAIVVVAALDPLHDEGVAYAQKLAQAGVPVTLHDEPGIVHGFYTMTKALPSGLNLTSKLIETIKAELS